MINGRIQLMVFLLLFIVALVSVSCSDDDDDDTAGGDDDTATDDDASDDDDNDTGADDDDIVTDDDDDDETPVYTWSAETVDDVGEVGAYSSLALDDAGRAHIAYYDATNTALKYAVTDEKIWPSETVDDDGEVGQYSSLALDDSGNAVIAYYDAADDGYLKVATNASGVWATERVATAAGLYVSLALDSTGAAHISHVDATAQELLYTTDASGSWVTTTVESLGTDWSLITNTSLALDGNDRPHIGYHPLYQGTDNDNQMRYARNLTGTWDFQTIVSEASTEISNGSLAVDGIGNVHACYYYHGWGQYSSALKYATNRTGSWVSTAVEWAGTVGKYTDLVADEAAVPHISYYSMTEGAVKYAVLFNENWFYTVVDSGNVGANTSLAVENGNLVQISYQDLGNLDLKFAVGQMEK